jgi:DNA polymerase III sliding clamp (beta) subunit (PCNA family)
VSSITFETATLASCIKKAERVAPNRGSAFDKAAGIVMESTGDVTVVRATDTAIYYTEWIDSVSFEGSAIQWRLPSRLFAQIIGSLPIGSGKEVTLTQDNRIIIITSGRLKAKVPLLDVEYYPTWQSFDPASLESTTGVGAKMSMVEWAAAKDNVAPYAGILFDGEYLYACDKYRLARVPLSIPHLTSPVLVPSNLLSGVLSQEGDVLLGAEGNNLYIMPDQHTQINTVLFEEEYPALDRLTKTEYTHSVKVRKAVFLEIANRVRGISQADRIAGLNVIIGKGELTIYMSDNEAALMDSVDLPSQADHARHTIVFAPSSIIEAVEHCPSEEVILSYDTSNPQLIFRVDGGSGYMAWIATRKN